MFTTEQINALKPHDFVGRKRICPKISCKGYDDGELEMLHPQVLAFDKSESERIVKSLKNIAEKLR